MTFVYSVENKLWVDPERASRMLGDRTFNKREESAVRYSSFLLQRL